MDAFPSVDLTGSALEPAVRQARGVSDAVTSAAVEISKEAVYTAVGLGILAYQRVQVRRREIEKSLQR
ncbi:MAG: hypothetical protein ABJH68_01590 [Ilumatobacter sp.]|uniref:hypothetical protein n=1 Tax=Ilumatobacter sp. TaxID=1967498 RepID=UPI003296D908